MNTQPELLCGMVAAEVRRKSGVSRERRVKCGPDEVLELRSSQPFH